MGRWTTEVTLDVAWGEMDALGHVNNIRYIAWADPRIALFRQLGMATLPGDPVGPILAPSSATTSSRWSTRRGSPSGCASAAWETPASSSSTRSARRNAGAVVARGKAVVVLINYATRRKYGFRTGSGALGPGEQSSNVERRGTRRTT